MSRGARRFLVVGAWAFFLSVIFGIGSRSLLGHLPLIPSFGLLLFVVFVGILFDIIGVAATAAHEGPFHAMAADKVFGAAHAIWIVRNADRVANFSNDMVGDIAGTLSGAIAATIVLQLAEAGANETLLSSVVLAGVAALTVGGKAYGKGFAVREANRIVHIVGKLLQWTEAVTGRLLPWAGNTKGSRARRRSRAPRAKRERK